MSTCLSNSQRLARTVTQDDEGSLTRIHSLSSAETVHANAGFENGTTHWGQSGLANFYIQTLNTIDGAQSLRIKPSSSGGYAYQSMNYVYSGGKVIDARTNHRKFVSDATTGSVTLNILVRSVSYGSSGCTGQFKTGLNQNNRTGVGSWTVVRTQTGSPTNSWQTLTETTTYTIPSSGLYEVRVKVSSNVKYTASGLFALLGLDTTRVRDRS